MSENSNLADVRTSDMGTALTSFSSNILLVVNFQHYKLYIALYKHSENSNRVVVNSCWLRDRLLKDGSLSPDEVKNVHFPISPRPALRLIQSLVQ